MGKGVGREFEGVAGVGLDGSVWLWYADGSVEKYSLGTPQSFVARDVYPKLESVDGGFTSEKAEGVYLLDKAGGRVVVVDKEGNYLAQYEDESLSRAYGLVVFEEEKKMIYLADNKLNLIVLEHLK